MTAAVAAPNALAVRAGLDVVEAGGTAVDAAVAAMLVAMCTEPGVVSPLGGGFVAVWPHDGDPEVIDANVEMPGRGLPAERFGEGLMEFAMSYGGGITVYAGPGSVATPGALSGLGLAHERHGRVPWREVVAPAATAAREGFPLGAAAASYLAITGDLLFAWDPETAALLLHPGGEPRLAGEKIVDPNLAAALDRIGEAGATDVYTGDLARVLAGDQQERGGLVTAADLAAYRPVIRAPLRLRAGSWDLATNAPPSIGGPVLAVMLGELVRRGTVELADVLDIQQRVLGHRLRVHDFSRDLEKDGYDLLALVERHGLVGLPTSGSTAHVSAVDAAGTACAITASSGYGSGATVPGTGLMLNNCLGEPELNRLGLHALEPGTRLASNMSPTVGQGTGAPSGAGPVLAIGSPGADRITTALMQVLGRFCLEGLDLADAIDRPRIHVTYRGDFSDPSAAAADASDADALVLDEPVPVVQIEDDGDLVDAVEAAGLEAVVHPRRSMFFGGVAAAYRRDDGSLGAAADARRESATGIS
ncbi:MAG TPA: gamma-glutamyltransferase [Lapillicoccus sp.]|nr:gamma-glutamyltransferase [Lapillicoccus sp.]